MLRVRVEFSFQTRGSASLPLILFTKARCTPTSSCLRIQRCVFANLSIVALLVAQNQPMHNEIRTAIRLTGTILFENLQILWEGNIG